MATRAAVVQDPPHKATRAAVEDPPLSGEPDSGDSVSEVLEHGTHEEGTDAEGGSYFESWRESIDSDGDRPSFSSLGLGEGSLAESMQNDAPSASIADQYPNLTPSMMNPGLVRGDSYQCLTDIEASVVERAISPPTTPPSSSPEVNGMTRGDSYKCLTDIEAQVWSPPQSPDVSSMFDASSDLNSGYEYDIGLGESEASNVENTTSIVRIVAEEEPHEGAQESCNPLVQGGATNRGLQVEVTMRMTEEEEEEAEERSHQPGRRRALSGSDSPRAEGLPDLNGVSQWGLDSGLDSSPTGSNSSASPKLSPQMERVLTGGGLRNSKKNFFIDQAKNEDVLPEASAFDAPVQRPQPTRRRGLSGCDSPRAPGPNWGSLDGLLEMENLEV